MQRLLVRLRRLALAQRGQTTTEYALVILAAAAIAIVLLTWARSSDALPSLFEEVIERISGGSR